MGWIYNRICVPLMLINNNVYTFISGILVALSINIFTSLCTARTDFTKGLYLYLSTVVFLAASAMCMYLAVSISRFQNYIIEKRIVDYDKRKGIVLDATRNELYKWVIMFLITIFAIWIGIGLLGMNFLQSQ